MYYSLIACIWMIVDWSIDIEGLYTLDMLQTEAGMASRQEMQLEVPLPHSLWIITSLWVLLESRELYQDPLSACHMAQAPVRKLCPNLERGFNWIRGVGWNCQ